MSPFEFFRLLADLVLLLHLAVVLFIVGGLALILAGGWRAWHWVRNTGFRVAHLVAIAYVAAQSWAGIACPLTVLESWLRIAGGQGAYQSGFIQDRVQRLLYYQAPAWVFVGVYTGFAACVAVAWWWVRPGRDPD